MCGETVQIYLDLGDSMPYVPIRVAYLHDIIEIGTFGASILIGTKSQSFLHSTTTG